MTAFITGARRSAVAPQGGAFAALSLHELAAPVILAALADAGIAPHQVDELIVSNALGAGGNPARLIALAAGLPQHVGGLTIDRQCAGGLDAVGLAAALVISGRAKVVVAGGVESHSRRPLRYAQAPGQEPVAYDRPPFTPWPDRDPDMVQAAADLADRLHISRAVQEAWAQRSHERALKACHPEIVPIMGLDHDPFMRRLSPRLLQRAPVLAGSITAATTAIRADGAAFTVVVGAELVQLAPRVMQIISAHTCGDVPDCPGLSPVRAISHVMAQAGIGVKDLAQIELMEAYGAQALACISKADLPMDRVNVKGGALARGHPIGASGAILATGLFHRLSFNQYGLAAIAGAGGIGSAVILKN